MSTINLARFGKGKIQLIINGELKQTIIEEKLSDIEVPLGSMVTLKAIPDAGYVFDNWRNVYTGATLSIDPSFFITVDKNSWLVYFMETAPVIVETPTPEPVIEPIILPPSPNTPDAERVGNYCSLQSFMVSNQKFYDVYHDTLGKIYSGNTYDQVKYKATGDYRCYPVPTTPPCVTITITHRNWGDPRNAAIGFYSSTLDGRYAQGDQAWGWGGYPQISDANYLETVAIPKTLAYLGGNFQNIYRRSMVRSDICGQPKDCISRWTCEAGNTGYEVDGCGNRRANQLCSKTPVIFHIQPLPAQMTISTIGTITIVGTAHEFNLVAGVYQWKIEKEGYLSQSGEFNSKISKIFNITLIAVCSSEFKCEEPLNGYDSNGCGTRRRNSICNPSLPPCVSNWKCVLPLNGYEEDGCGSVRKNTECNPVIPPCVEGTTRLVTCPQNGRLVTQDCVNGLWISRPAEVIACMDDKDNTILIIIGAVLILYLIWRK